MQKISLCMLFVCFLFVSYAFPQQSDAALQLTQQAQAVSTQMRQGLQALAREMSTLQASLNSSERSRQEALTSIEALQAQLRTQSEALTKSEGLTQQLSLLVDDQLTLYRKSKRILIFWTVFLVVLSLVCGFIAGRILTKLK